MLIGSILAGAVFAVIGEIFYRTFHNGLPRVAMAELYFVGLFLFLGLAIWLIGKTVYSRTFKGVLWGQWIKIFLGMLVLTAAFELLYEIRIKWKAPEIDSYIFAIDNSGSMDSSDPEGLRFAAIDAILEEKPGDFQYAVYTFSDDVVLARQMGGRSQGEDYDKGVNGGGTAVRKTLETILEDIESGELHLAGGTAHVIFLSDGYATDIKEFNKYGITTVLNQYAQKEISVSTVGLLDADEDLLALMAEKTGGVFVDVDDVANLEAAMSEAGNPGTEDMRHLLGYRNAVRADILYAVMRILFITGLGVVIGLEKAVICEKFLDTAAVIRSSAVGSALAGICIEVGMNGLGIHPVLIRVLGCILISFTLLREDFIGEDDSDMLVLRADS